MSLLHWPSSDGCKRQCSSKISRIRVGRYTRSSWLYVCDALESLKLFLSTFSLLDFFSFHVVPIAVQQLAVGLDPEAVHEPYFKNGEKRLSVKSGTVTTAFNHKTPGEVYPRCLNSQIWMTIQYYKKELKIKLDWTGLALGQAFTGTPHSITHEHTTWPRAKIIMFKTCHPAASQGQREEWAHV